MDWSDRTLACGGIGQGRCHPAGGVGGYDGVDVGGWMTDAISFNLIYFNLLGLGFGFGFVLVLVLVLVL